MHNCEGCTTRKNIGSPKYLAFTKACPYIERNNNGACPCTKCIVKTMCRQRCEPFDVFIGYIIPQCYTTNKKDIKEGDNI